MHAGSVGMSLLRCPSCGGSRRTSFYSQERVPVHSCLLLPTREEAERFPRGTIRLAFCEDCGCIWNTEFDPTLTAYSPAYEDSQAFSPRFRTFADELAAELVERYDVHGKRVLEIGCGKGDFLLRLCALGGNSGTGIDPAVDSVEGAESDAEGVTFIADVYSERYTGIPADLMVFGGFSQGAVMAYALALGAGRPQPPALIALSGFIPTVDGFEIDLTDRRGLSVAIGHGINDKVIPPQCSRQARAQLEEAGADVVYRESRMPHAVDPRFLYELPDMIYAAIERTPALRSEG